jgi:hypothetical protein
MHSIFELIFTEDTLMDKFNFFELAFLLIELEKLLDELNIEYIAIKRTKK